MNQSLSKLFYLLISISLLFANNTIEKAELLIISKKYYEAIEILLKIVDENDANHKAFFLLGKAYFNLENFEKAVENLEEATDLYDKSFEYFNLYGEALFKEISNVSVLSIPFYAGNIKDSFNKSLELEPNNIHGLILKAKYLTVAPSMFGGDKEQAIELAKKIMLKDKPTGLGIIFRVYYRDFKYTEAEMELMKIKELTGDISDHYQFYNQYGYHLLREDKLLLALEKFKLQVELAPTQANAYDSLAECYLRLKNYEEAKSNYEKAFQLNPDLKNEETKDRILDIDVEFGPYLFRLFKR